MTNNKMNTGFSKNLIDFIDNSECWLYFYHNESDWMKTNDLKADFYNRLSELVNEGRHFILMLDFYTDLGEQDTETFIGNKEEIEYRLEQAQQNFKDEDGEHEFENEVEYVYDILQDKYCEIKRNVIVNWTWT